MNELITDMISPKKMEKKFKSLSVLEKKRRKSISKTLIEKKLRSNEKHPRWKGDRASKISLHIWIAKNKPKPEVCEFCKKKRKLNLANIKNHNYTRNIEDYKWLCYSCHKKMDLGNRKNTIIIKKWIKPHLMKNNPRYKGGKYSKVKGHYRTWRIKLT